MHFHRRAGVRYRECAARHTAGGGAQIMRFGCSGAAAGAIAVETGAIPHLHRRRPDGVGGRRRRDHRAAAAVGGDADGHVGAARRPGNVRKGEAVPRINEYVAFRLAGEIRHGNRLPADVQRPVYVVARQVTGGEAAPLEETESQLRAGRVPEQRVHVRLPTRGQVDERGLKGCVAEMCVVVAVAVARIPHTQRRQPDEGGRVADHDHGILLCGGAVAHRYGDRVGALGERHLVARGGGVRVLRRDRHRRGNVGRLRGQRDSRDVRRGRSGVGRDIRRERRRQRHRRAAARRQAERRQGRVGIGHDAARAAAGDADVDRPGSRRRAGEEGALGGGVVGVRGSGAKRAFGEIAERGLVAAHVHGPARVAAGKGRPRDEVYVADIRARRFPLEIGHLGGLRAPRRREGVGDERAFGSALFIAIQRPGCGLHRQRCRPDECGRLRRRGRTAAAVGGDADLQFVAERG